jgi:hypothetical protein
VDAKVDWFSFTVPTPEFLAHKRDSVIDDIVRITHEATGGILHDTLSDRVWNSSRAAGFYDVRYWIEGAGVSVSFGSTNTHALWEFSGQGCELLRQYHALYGLAAAMADRATRIDFAVDIETDTLPADFVAQASCKAFKSRGTQNSPTGLTEYIGSRKGERMARVYRYFDPHPRAAFLRAEAEYKGDLAREFCRHLDEASLTMITLQAHLPFGWTHPVWNPDKIEADKLMFTRTDKEAARTIQWLMEAVIPSLVRADREGILSWEAFEEAFRKKAGR